MPLSTWALYHTQQVSWIREMAEEASRLRQLHGADAVADLALGQPLEPTSAVRSAFVAATRESHTGRHSYMHTLGYPEVREHVARGLAEKGITGRHVVMTPGAAAALCIALQTFVNPGDEIIGITPYFSEFPLYCVSRGLSFIPVSSRSDWSLDIDAIESALNARTGAVILNSPCNPTGHVTTHRELSALARLLTDHYCRTGRRVLLLVDEVYHQLIYQPATYVNPLDYYDRTVLARSFSKDLGIAGERLGYLVIHPEMDGARVQKAITLCMRSQGLVNASATAQRALLYLDPTAVDVSPYRERRDALVSIAHDLDVDITTPDGAMYLWVRSPWKDTIAFVRALAERLVVVTPGVAFGNPDYFRICLSAPIPRLKQAMRAIAELGSSEPFPLAGREGFEPSEGLNTPHPLSRRALSASSATSP